MRILFVTDTCHPHINDIYYFICKMGALLQTKGHRVAVIAPSQTYHYTKSRINNIDVYAMPSLPLPHYPNLRVTMPFSVQSRLKNVIGSFNPDVIHIQDHFILSKAVVKLNRKLNIPLIATNHFLPASVSSFIKNKMIKRVIENFWWSRFSDVFNEALLVTTYTEAGARIIRPRLDADVIPISGSVYTEPFTSFEKKQRIKNKYGLVDKPVLLYVGRLDTGNHIDGIIEAVAKVAKTIDFCFVVAGNGNQKAALEKQVKELHIEDRVMFTGFVPEEDLYKLYGISRCFITATTTELHSLAILQAMAAGLPVIAPNAGAVDNFVQDKNNGYLFNPGDTDTIAASITRIFSNDYLHVHMAKKSLEYIRLHDIRTTAASFERAYKSCYVRNIIIRHHKEELVSGS
ncbi:MAG: putative Glucosyltransferase [Ferruginibacter sp.]|uniref:glycosyltransferase n=1 Tax=Ferruginibacter sp. TaxID=1940288 RepID=UPI002657B3E4|nr:glycosyltransferase [Ferruginibacter sp.]MDB5278725.1 putative Glucosyltransferase [Ferruginibacter sp.]